MQNTSAKYYWSAVHLLLVQKDFIGLPFLCWSALFLFGQFSRAGFKRQRKYGCGGNIKKRLCKKRLPLRDWFGIVVSSKVLCDLNSSCYLFSLSASHCIVASHRLKLRIHFLSDQPSAPCKELLERAIQNYFVYIFRSTISVIAMTDLVSNCFCNIYIMYLETFQTIWKVSRPSG